VHTDHGSQGIAQWRLDRLTNLERFCEERGLAVTNLAAQLLFLEHELKDSYPKLNVMLKEGTRSIANLTANFSAMFERPSKRYENLDFRIAEAEKCTAAYTPPAQPKAPIVAGTIAVVGTAGSAAYASSQGIGGPILAGLLTLFVAAVLLTVSFYVQRWWKMVPATPITEATGKQATAIDELRDAMEELKIAHERIDAAEAVFLLQRKEADAMLEELKQLRGINHG
jgi:hypothetical protein